MITLFCLDNEGITCATAQSTSHRASSQGRVEIFKASLNSKFVMKVTKDCRTSPTPPPHPPQQHWHILQFSKLPIFLLVNVCIYNTILQQQSCHKLSFPQLHCHVTEAHAIVGQPPTTVI